MLLPDAERQQRYRERKEAQCAKRYQIMLPQFVAEQVREICKNQNCTKAELFSRLVDGEDQKLKGK